MIPKIIHRLWINPPGPPMPDEFRRYGEQWKALNPDWSLIDWTCLGSLHPLINQAEYDGAEGPDLHRYRADIVRLEVLLTFGGVYVDCDIEPLKPIDEVIGEHACILATSANRRKGGREIVSNSFMAAIPGHPLIRAFVHWLPASAKAYRGKHTAVAVGPYHLDRVLATGHWPDVHILPEWVFYPQSIADRKAGKDPDLSRAYGWHRWVHSRGAVPA